MNVRGMRFVSRVRTCAPCDARAGRRIKQRAHLPGFGITVRYRVIHVRGVMEGEAKVEEHERVERHGPEEDPHELRVVCRDLNMIAANTGFNDKVMFPPSVVEYNFSHGDLG